MCVSVPEFVSLLMSVPVSVRVYEVIKAVHSHLRDGVITGA